MTIKSWVRLPSSWIKRSGLANMKWKSGGEGADNVAALITLTAIAHAADEDTGVARATYDELCVSTSLSRAKLSNGLQVLHQLKILEPVPEGRSTHGLV